MILIIFVFAIKKSSLFIIFFLLSTKTNKGKSTEILLIAIRGQQKVPTLKKTTGLCFSMCYYSMGHRVIPQFLDGQSI